MSAPRTEQPPPGDTLGAGMRTIPEFEGVHKVWPRGDRLQAVREAALAYRERFRGQGRIHAVRSFDIAAAPYPTRYAFHGAAIGPNPFVNIVNRVLVVHFDGFDKVPRTLVWEPTVAAGSSTAPFYAQLKRLAGDFLSDRVFTRYYHEPEEVLPLCGLRPQDVDYVSFDHLHVQDVRLIMGSSKPLPGQATPPEPLFPRASLLVHRKELGTFASPHPMQWAWYVDGGMDGVPEDRVAAFDEDVELGVGVSLLWTPGHTDGNHSLVLNTPDGIWVSSENGVAADNWQPELSRIPGVRRHARFFGHEIVPNANTLEDSLDQYDSMVKEKTLADRSARDPRWLQILPSSEIARWKRQWPVWPTYSHGGLRYGSFPGEAADGRGETR
ncbi:hypothetical protein OHA27_36115 [Streptomyces sp. NBC_01619]|uniref:hypothetical protein n=1 Tax=Streptomyces sp. NBC_01619 TaxID=2975901 RepID=UPI00225008BC|nr:hypothetical protein [Streptomyces sp. NBC_01619]MCX4515634.1 hypothetical protein [Streptomyces sp. NBC_01619]